MEKFHGKVVIVTGAAQGIGNAIAKRLLSEGATVAFVDQDQKKLASSQSSGQSSDRALPFTADVTQKQSIQAVVDSLLSAHGKIDVLVNNAGIIRDGLLLNLTEEDWDSVLAVNLKGAFLCSQAVLSSMKEKKYGKIVNISSRSWLGNIGQSNYSAAKAGLIGLTRTLALEFARYQININAVAPGLIDTPMTRGLPEEARTRLLKMQPTGKMGTPDDIAAAVSFLASDEASFITGQVLHVDGGKSCGILSL